MTNGGGAGVMAADAAALAGVPRKTLDEKLLAQLDPPLPPTWSRANPIDIIGDAPVERYVATLRTLLTQTDAAVLFVHAPTAIVRSAEIARACLPLLRAHPGRVMACWLGAAAIAEARLVFEEAGIADYVTPEEAVRAFAMLATYRRNQQLLLQAPPQTPPVPRDREGARRIVERALADGREWLGEADVTALLRFYGIPIVRSLVVTPDADAALAAAHDVG